MLLFQTSIFLRSDQHNFQKHFPSTPSLKMSLTLNMQAGITTIALKSQEEFACNAFRGGCSVLFYAGLVSGKETPIFKLEWDVSVFNDS